MAVHNQEQYLEEAIASVQAQTYPHQKLILLGDRSPQSPALICCGRKAIA
jgi:glycosyltransferase involved in cell wall biosynthesis